MSDAVYARITTQIIQKLEKGVVPWHKPWKSGPASFPANLASRRRYRGINVFILACQGYNSPFWLTFRQAGEMGGTIKKGEKSTAVVFWKKQEVLTETGEDKPKPQFPVLRYYHLFNLEQCHGIQTPKPIEGLKPVEYDPIDAAERIIAGYPTPPKIEFRGDQALYRPKEDLILCPIMGRFTSVDGYYSTLFHELTHSTGHEDRLNRKTLTDLCPFGSTNYSKEELVAEMGAAMLSAEAGLDVALVDNSASYIAGWLKRLTNDPRLVVMAAGQAQLAVDHILGRSFAIEEPVQAQNLA